MVAVCENGFCKIREICDDENKPQCTCAPGECEDTKCVNGFCERRRKCGGECGDCPPQDCMKVECIGGQCRYRRICSDVCPCNDGDPCTYDMCVKENPEDPEGECQIRRNCASGCSCDDHDDCTDDVCMNEECRYFRKCTGGCECDTGESCTAYQCVNGYCQEWKTCDDQGGCTCEDRVCQTHECLYGRCEYSYKCTYSRNDPCCDDGDPCTTPVGCENGKCVFERSCTDNDWRCCEDNNPCTEVTGCLAGVCQYRPIPLPCSAELYRIEPEAPICRSLPVYLELEITNTESSLPCGQAYSWYVEMTAGEMVVTITPASGSTPKLGPDGSWIIPIVVTVSENSPLGTATLTAYVSNGEETCSYDAVTIELLPQPCKVALWGISTCPGDTSLATAFIQNIGVCPEIYDWEVEIEDGPGEFELGSPSSGTTPLLYPGEMVRIWIPVEIVEGDPGDSRVLTLTVKSSDPTADPCDTANAYAVVDTICDDDCDPKDDCSFWADCCRRGIMCPIKKLGGPGLHLDIATGDVVTQVPILQLFGEGDASVDFYLTYSSRHADEKTTVGWGWTHSYNVHIQNYDQSAGGFDGHNRFIVVDELGRHNAFRYPQLITQLITPPKGRITRLFWDTTTGGLVYLYPDGTTWLFGTEENNAVWAVRRFDPRGGELKLDYDNTSGLLTKITDKFGREVTLGYDPNTHLLDTVSAYSCQTTLGYDANDRLTRVTDANAHSVTFAYTSQYDTHYITQETQKNGTAWNAEYTALSREIKDSHGDRVIKAESTYFPLPIGHLGPLDDDSIKCTDGNAHEWQYTRDSSGRLLSKRLLPNGPESSVEYGTPGTYEHAFIVRATNERGLTRTAQWNPNGTPVSITDEAGNVTTYEYRHPGASGLASAVVEPGDDNGRRWTYKYNDHNDFTEIHDPAGAYTSIAYEYYATGRPGRLQTRTLTDPNGHVTVEYYDANGGLTRTTSGQSAQNYLTESFHWYDSFGRRTQTTVQRGTNDQVVGTFGYDCLGQLTTSTVDPGQGHLNLTATYAYDESGLLTRFTNPRGINTDYEYDYRDRLTQQTADADQINQGHFNYTTALEYDGMWNVTTRTDPRGNTVTSYYDAYDRLTRAVDALTYESLFLRDPAGNITRYSRQRDMAPSYDVVDYEYDNINRVTKKIVDPGGQGYLALETQYEYATSGGGCSSCASYDVALPTKVTDPLGKISLFAYDKRDRLTRAVAQIGASPSDGDDIVVQHHYDPVGNKTSVDGPEGELTAFQYDAVNRLTLQRVVLSPPATNLTTTYTYDGASNLKTVLTPDENLIAYLYDSANRLTKTQDSESQSGHIALYVYDANGNVLTRTNALNESWVAVYDNLDRVTQGTDPLTRATTYEYNENSLLTITTDAEGTKWKQEYDGLNRLTRTLGDYDGTVVKTKNLKTEYTYDGAGRLLTYKSYGGTAGDQTTTYTYDAAGRNTVITYPDTEYVTLAYDAASNITHRTDRNGTETTYAYDDAHRLTQRAAPSRTETYEYDRSGRVLSAGVGTLSSSYGYDRAGRITLATQQFSGTPYMTSFEYTVPLQGGGSERAITSPSSRHVYEASDVRGRLAQIDFGSALAERGFDLADRRTSEQVKIGSTTELQAARGFDVSNQLTSLVYQNTGGNVVSLGYAYDAVGNPRYTENLLTSPDFTNRDELYAYDDLHRFSRLDRGELNAQKDAIATPYPGADLPLPWYIGWDLDRRGNWKSLETVIGAQDLWEDREHDTVNAVSTIDPDDGQGARTLTRDDNGNLTTDPLASIVTAAGQQLQTSLTYNYDAENRLRTVQRTGTNIILLDVRYDAEGRRSWWINYDETGTELRRTRAIWLGAQVIAEYESTDAGSNWALAREFVWGAAFPEPVAMIDYTAKGATGAGQAEPFYYVRDRLGSVVALTDASGAVVERYSYDPYGATYITDASGVQSTPPRLTSAYGNPYAFVGQRYDAEVGLYHLMYRSYCPRLGRWLQQDPAGYGDGANLYNYVSANPLRNVDPSGGRGKAKSDWTDGARIRYEQTAFWFFTGEEFSLGTVRSFNGHEYVETYNRNYERVLLTRESVEEWAKADRMELDYRDWADKHYQWVIDPLDSKVKERPESGETLANAFSDFVQQTGESYLTVGSVLAPTDNITVLISGTHEDGRNATGKDLRQAPLSLAATTAMLYGGCAAGAWASGVSAGGACPPSPRIACGPPRYGTWNEFQAGTKGLFQSRADAAGVWQKCKEFYDMASGVTRAGPIHGNSLLSPATNYLYRLSTIDGEFLKWGVSQNPWTRYSRTFMANKSLEVVGQGSRADMIGLERYFVETQPGPLNFEPWAGSAAP